MQLNILKNFLLHFFFCSGFRENKDQKVHGTKVYYNSSLFAQE